MRMPERRHMVLCTVTDVRDGQVVYPCCAQCCSKLRSDCFQDRWQCLKCGCSSSSGDLEWRYRLSLMVSDGPVLTNICLFGSVLQQFFGMPSNQFVRFLRKVESMYGNSEEVLLLGLKHCFIGQQYYFGVKVAASSQKENVRMGLADVVKQRRTACQNSMLSQEDSSSTIAFQMVPAVNRESRTVYEIIRNFFKDSRDETGHDEETDKFNSSGMSSMQKSNFESSRSNTEQNSVTLGQTTALLSCELSDIEKTSLASASKNKTILSCKKKEHKIGNSFIMSGSIVKDHCLNNKGNIAMETNSVFMGDNRNRSQETGQELSPCKSKETVSRRNIFPSDTNTLQKKKNAVECPSNESMICLNSEPLYSQETNTSNSGSNDVYSSHVLAPYNNKNGRKDFFIDNQTLYCETQECVEDDPRKKPHDGHNKRSNKTSSYDSSHLLINTANSCHNTTNFKMNKNASISLEGTLLLQNLKIPNLPENVPDSEELDLFLLNDSSFGSDFQDLSQVVECESAKFQG